MSRKPRIFIGSSTDSLKIADAINENLDHTAEVTIWRDGTFSLSTYKLDSLIERANNVDFALFIFSPDDLIAIRDNEHKTLRDNVIFELGLFIGTIGRQRSYIIKPRNIDLYLPTDLLGLTTCDYESNRSDNDYTSALNMACSLIKKEVVNHGLLDSRTAITKVTIPNERDFKLNTYDVLCLAKISEAYTKNIDGFSLRTLLSKVAFDSNLLNFSLIKLEKIQLIQRMNAQNEDGEDFYLYSITQDGMHHLIKNEAILLENSRLLFRT